MKFYKYHGAGNDFILIDNRTQEHNFSQELIALMCHRRYGIGADGLMLLENDTVYDFRMLYYNSDGKEGTMCGNGGRCIVRFAHDLGIFNHDTNFIAIDGEHTATILPSGDIALSMQDVKSIKRDGEAFVLDTGSPHYVIFKEDIQGIDVYSQGKIIRNSSQYVHNGINVNFVRRDKNQLDIRTYERGVEDETLACGTGITASAIASTNSDLGKYDIKVKALGGTLSVAFIKDSATSAKAIMLTGPAVKVFEGNWKMK